MSKTIISAGPLFHFNLKFKGTESVFPIETPSQNPIHYIISVRLAFCLWKDEKKLYTLRFWIIATVSKTSFKTEKERKESVAHVY